MTKTLLLLCVLYLGVCESVAGTGDSKKPWIQDMQVHIDPTVDSEVSARITPDHISPLARPAVGTYTTLNGFYDLQANGGAVQHVQVNPANGNIHVTYMLAEDSALFASTRRVGYAFSTDNGQSWNNYNNLRVPARSAGFPTLTLLKGPVAGLPAIGSHSTITGTQSAVFIDSPEGAGAFSELNPPPLIGGTNEPIWPNIAGASDGSVVMASSPNVAPEQNYWTRSADFSTWSPWLQFSSINNRGGRYPTYANDNGRVGTLHGAGNANGAWWMASSDNGVTWSTAQNIYPISPPGRETATDTFRIWVGVDFIWDGDTPLMTINEQNLTAPRNNQGQILFWSQATGFVVVANTANTPNVVVPPLNVSQSNHINIGWPVLAKSGNTLVIVYQALTTDTATNRINYSDIYYSRSENNGVSWSSPVTLTNTPTLDERYPSVSRWNPPGFVNITWQEDPEPGAYVIGTPDVGARPSRTRQVFHRLPLPPVSVGHDETVANAFKLTQNYPNPFNPATKIDYTVGQSGPVSIKVFNMLGQEVATLLNENVSAGTYQVTFDAGHLSSGVYLYKMTAGSYSELKKMVFMK